MGEKKRILPSEWVWVDNELRAIMRPIPFTKLSLYVSQWYKGRGVFDTNKWEGLVIAATDKEGDEDELIARTVINTFYSEDWNNAAASAERMFWEGDFHVITNRVGAE